MAASLPGVNALLEIGFARVSTRISSTLGYKTYGSSSGGKSSSAGAKSSQTASQSRKLSQSVTRSANRSGPFAWFKRGNSGMGSGIGAKEGSKERLHSEDHQYQGQPVQVGDYEKTGTARYEMEITDVELGGIKRPHDLEKGGHQGI